MTMRSTIESKLVDALAPEWVEVVDESHMHNVPKGAESHFNVFVVSDAFEGLRLVARHQTVYRALSDEMAGSVHALALKTMTPAEWKQSGGGLAESPQCLGGSKAD